MKNFKIWCVTVLLGTMASGMAFSQDNVFVRLYTERVNVAKAEVRKQEAEAEYQKKHYDRMAYLYARSAASKEEYERSEADYRKSIAEVDLLTARAKEEEASLEVVRHLVQNSQPVPLCRD